MRSNIVVPTSLFAAAKELRQGFQTTIEALSPSEFVRMWCAIAYTFPGLHPDGYEDAGSGWPRALRKFGTEAWRRYDRDELTEAELYACDAQWAGIYDRLEIHAADENERRLRIAIELGAASGS